MMLVICAISLLAFASAGGQHIKGGSRIVHQHHPLLRGAGLGGGQILSKRGGGGGLHHSALLDPITQQQAISGDPISVVQEQIIGDGGLSRAYRIGQSQVPYGLSGLDYYSYPAGLGTRRLGRKTVLSDNLSGLSPVGSRIKGGGLSGGRLRFGGQPQVTTVTRTLADPSLSQFSLGDAQIATDPFGSRRNQYRVGQSLVPYGLSGLDYYSYPSQLFRQTPVTKGGFGRIQTISGGGPGNIQFSLGDSQVAAIDPIAQVVDQQPQITTLTETVRGGGLDGLGGGGQVTTTTVTKSAGGGLGGVSRAVTKGGGIGGAQFVLGGGQFGGRRGGQRQVTTVTKSAGGGLGGGLSRPGNIQFVLGDGAGLGGLGQGVGGQRQVTTVTKTSGGGLGGGVAGGPGNIQFVLGDGSGLGGGLGGAGQQQVTTKTVTKSSGAGLGGLGGAGIGGGNNYFVLGDGSGLGGGAPQQVTKTTVTRSGGGRGIGGAQFVLGGGQLGGLSRVKTAPRQVTKTTVTQSGGGALGHSGGVGPSNIHFVLGDGTGLGGGLGGGAGRVTTKTVTKSAGDGLGGLGLGGLGGGQVTTKTVTKSAGDGLGGLGLGRLGGGQVTTKTVTSAGDGLGGLGLGGVGQVTRKTVTKSAGSGLGGAGIGGGNIQFVLGDGSGLGLGGGGQRQVTTVTKSAGDGLGGLGLGGLGGGQVTTKTVTSSAGDGLGGLGLGGVGQVTRKTVTKSGGGGFGGAGIGGGNIQFVLGDGSGLGGGGQRQVTKTTVTEDGLGGQRQVTRTAVTKSAGGGGIRGAQFVLGGGVLPGFGGRRGGQVTKTTVTSGDGLGGLGLGGGRQVTTTTVTKGGDGGVLDPVGQEKIILSGGGLGSGGLGQDDIQVLVGDGVGAGGLGGFSDGIQLALDDSDLGGGSSGGLGLNQQKLSVIGGLGSRSSQPTFVTQVRGADGVGTFGNRLSQVQYIQEGRLGGLFPGYDLIGGSRVGDPRYGYYQRPIIRTSGPSIQYTLGDDQGFSTLDGQGHVDASFEPQRVVVAQEPVLRTSPRIRARKITTLRKAGPLAGAGNIQFTLGDSALGGSGLGRSQVAYLDDGGLSNGGFGQRKVTTTTVRKAAPAPVIVSSSRVLDPVGSGRGGPVVRRVTTVRRPQAIDAQDRIESTLVQDGLGSGLSGVGGSNIQFQLGDNDLLSGIAAPGVVQTVQQVVDPAADSRQVQLDVGDVLEQSALSQPSGVTRVKETTVTTGTSPFGDPTAVEVTKVTDVAQSPIGISSGGFNDGDLQQKLVSGDIGADLGGYYSPRVSFTSHYPYDVPSGSFLRSLDPVQQVVQEQQRLDDPSDFDGFSGLYSPRVSFTSQYPYDVPAGVVLRAVDPSQQVAQEALEQVLV